MRGALVVAALLAAAPAGAIEYEMVGEIVEDTLPGVLVGDTVVVLLQVDPGVVDSQPDPQRGVYEPAVLGVGIDRGFLEPLAVACIDGLAAVLNDVQGDALLYDGDLCADQDFLPWMMLGLLFEDPSGTVFQSDALPVELDPSRFAQAFVLGQDFFGGSFVATIDSVTVVPEAAGGPLAALLALLLLVRRAGAHRLPSPLRLPLRGLGDGCDLGRADVAAVQAFATSDELPFAIGHSIVAGVQATLRAVSCAVRPKLTQLCPSARMIHQRSKPQLPVPINAIRRRIFPHDLVAHGPSPLRLTRRRRRFPAGHPLRCRA